MLYFSDNGPNSWRWNGGMKGRKGSTDEGGVRVPCLVRWPGHIRPAARIPQIAGAIDLLPTLADLAGLPVDTEQAARWQEPEAIAPGAKEGVARPDDFLASCQANQRAHQRYRLDPGGQLFDMSADPGRSAISRGRSRGSRRCFKERSPSGAGRCCRWWVRMIVPSRWVLAKPHCYPRATVFRKAASSAAPILPTVLSSPTGRADDRMTWDIEVGRAGQYEAVIHYTCRRDDLGATVELSFDDSRIEAKLTEVHDPALVGAAADRVQRAESYVKDFRPFRLGALRLRAGRGQLILKAVNIPGSEVADIRYIELKIPLTGETGSSSEAEPGSRASSRGSAHAPTMG